MTANPHGKRRKEAKRKGVATISRAELSDSELLERDLAAARDQLQRDAEALDPEVADAAERQLRAWYNRHQRVLEQVEIYRGAGGSKPTTD